LSEIVKVLVSGDFCPRIKTEMLLLDKKYELVFKEVLSEFIGNDLNIVNLECPLTVRSKAISKTGPPLKANPDSIYALHYLQVQLAAISNNHIMDYGGDGLLDTISECRKAGIYVVGAGPTLLDARQPFLIQLKGMIIAVINVSENEFSSTYGSYPGANPLNPMDNYTDIVEAKKKADKVIVLYHGGNEYYELPSPRVKKTCRFFVDAGADAVVMHHTHIISGFEQYKHAPIFYGLGNFNFDWDDRIDQPWNYGYSVRLRFDEKKTEFDLVPHKQSNGTPGTLLLEGSEKKLFFQNISRLNAIIENDKLLEDNFFEFCERKSRLYDMYIQPYSGKYLSLLYHKGILPNLYSKQKKQLLLNLIRCESHREVILHLFSK
jgi:poly-gamma-glutamate capsule biosynthesis protein CapA/YwtB (metallophosphatase superfamily)